MNADAFLAQTVPHAVVTTDESGVDRTRIVARARELEVVPFLRKLEHGDFGSDPDLRTAARIAIAKTTTEPADVGRIVIALRDARASNLEREGAAIALGLVRRTALDARFDGPFLDRVRASLFETFDDERIPVRTRCFCALSIGLLGDQPVREDDPFAKDGRLTTQALWTRVTEARNSTETSVALLVALSLQPPAGVPSTVREGLRSLATTGRLTGKPLGPVVQSHATLALARLARDEATGVCLALAKGTHQPADVRRSAVLSIGVLADELAPTARAAATDELLTLTRHADVDTMGFAVIAVGRLVAAGFADAQDERARCTKGVEALLDFASHGNSLVRPYAALALGIALRGQAVPVLGSRAGDGPVTPSLGADFDRLRSKALDAVREAADRESEDPEARAASVVALGLLRDEMSIPRLARLASRTDIAEPLRARACTALGLVGRPLPAVFAVLRSALARHAPDDVRREAGRSLGALGDSGAEALLVAELSANAPDHVRARAAVALGALRDVAAVRPLIRLAADKDAGDIARAIAAAGLGLVADPERVRSLSHLSTDTNYLARTDALNEAMTLL